jgi:hypothetical protein
MILRPYIIGHFFLVQRSALVSIGASWILRVPTWIKSKRNYRKVRWSYCRRNLGRRKRYSRIEKMKNNMREKREKR